MKMQWMKDILGDVYTEEMDGKVCQAIGERFVSRDDFNAKNSKVKELETKVAQLDEGVKTRDKQLEELKKSTGDNAELKQQIENLTAQNKREKEAHEKALAEVKLMAAVDAELTAAGSKNNIAVRAVLADYLKDASIVDGKVTTKVNGETQTLAAKIDTMKKDASTGFLFNAGTKYSGFKPGERSDGAPADGKNPKDMSYDELCAYLADHPDANL